MSETRTQNFRKVRVGKVVSTKMDKSFTLLFERVMRHPVYVKTFRTTTKFMVHDEKNEATVGDTVRVMETRPISKNKHWRLLEIVERAK